MKVTTIRCLAANYGFLQPDIFTMLSAAVSAGLFPCAESVAQRRAVPVQPAVLCLGRAGLCGADAVFHRVGLHLRANGRAAPGTAGSKDRAVGITLCQFGTAGRVQVQRLPDRHGQFLVRHGTPPAESAAAHRHQLLHVPDHELHHRRLPRRGKSAEEYHQFRRVCNIIPSVDCGPHHPLPDGSGRAGAPGLHR